MLTWAANPGRKLSLRSGRRALHKSSDTCDRPGVLLTFLIATSFVSTAALGQARENDAVDLLGGIYPAMIPTLSDILTTCMALETPSPATSYGQASRIRIAGFISGTGEFSVTEKSLGQTASCVSGRLARTKLPPPPEEGRTEQGYPIEFELELK